MSFLDTKHKKKSFTLTTVLLSVLLLLLFYMGLTYLDPPSEKGITVNFGTSSVGSGRQQPLERVRTEPRPDPVQPPTEQKVTPEPVVEEEPQVVEETPVPTEKVLTSEEEESIKIKQAEEAKKKAEAEAKRKAQEEAARKERERQEAEARKQAEEEAKRKKLDALIGGINKSEGTAQGGEGPDNQAGDKGQPQGNPYASSYYGSGSGSGTGYGLNGRSLVGQGQVQQECNEEGRVVVQIVVDRNGKVVKATPGVKGTTNTAPCLMEPAQQTAMLHRWNVDSNAPAQQVGFVVVNFKLGE